MWIVMDDKAETCCETYLLTSYWQEKNLLQTPKFPVFFDEWFRSLWKISVRKSADKVLCEFYFVLQYSWIDEKLLKTSEERTEDVPGDDKTSIITCTDVGVYEDLVLDDLDFNSGFVRLSGNDRIL